MSHKEAAKRPSGWTLMKNEHIENVKYVKLTPAAQRELGCVVGENVFLEYPWAYVPREVVTKLTGQTGSDLDVHADRINAYQAEKFLVGYASRELISTNFVICLTESARDQVQIRNRRITKTILEKVSSMMKKAPGTFIPVKTDEEVIQTLGKIARPLLEIEITIPVCQLRRKIDLGERNSDQTRDGYIELLPGQRKYNNVPMKMISRHVQTNLEGREMNVQCYFGYPKNKWTQYDEVIFVNAEKAGGLDPNQKESICRSDHGEESTEKVGSNVEETVDEVSRVPTPLETFLDSRFDEIIELAKYNSAINMHSSDIDNLVNRCAVDYKTEVTIAYKELGCFIFFGNKEKQSISDVSWHLRRPGCFATSYVRRTCCDLVGCSSIDETLVINDASQDLYSRVVIWSVSDPLQPKLILQDVREIRSMSFCPYVEDVLIGGSTNGQIVLWDLRRNLNDEATGYQNHSDQEDEIICEYPKLTGPNISIIGPVSVSNGHNSHVSPICAIRWLPTDCRIESSGKLSKLPENTSLQFMSASEDGSVAIWDLLWQPSTTTSGKSLKTTTATTMTFNENVNRLDGVFEPHFRIMIQSPKKSIGLTVLDLCLPRPSVFQAQASQQIDFEDEANAMKYLWLGVAQGHTMLGTWRGQEFESETGSSESMEILQQSSIHTEPVVQISRCPQVDDVLLSIGGHVFAIWKDDYLCAPLLWRRRPVCRYTACCWSVGIPGIFLLGRSDGELETWDISRKLSEPVLVQTFSGNLITGLYGTHGLSGDSSFRIIGICDYNGAFRLYEETVESCDENWERLEWFRNFVDREVERKREFHDWQDQYLKTNEKALERRAGRAAADAKRRHEEARQQFLRERDELARLKAERKLKNLPKSKDTLRRAKDFERAKSVLLQKKRFVPDDLEKNRIPLVQQQNEKNCRLAKSQKEIANCNSYFEDAMSCEFPEYHSQEKHDVQMFSGNFDKTSDEIIREDFEKYSVIQDAACKRLSGKPRLPVFNWNVAMNEGRRRKGH